MRILGLFVKIYAHRLHKCARKTLSINFNDLIEFHAIRKADCVDIKLRPGMGAKLIIKSDESTEADDGYDD